MRTPVVLLRIGGVFNLLYGLLHIAFWRHFNWSEELALLRFENSNIMQMMNLVLIAFFFYTGYMLLKMPVKLLSDSVGRMFIGLFIFLFVSRLGMEFYFPGTSLVFALIMVVTLLCFIVPLLQTKTLSHAH